jgi:transposase, IS6 family
MRTAQRIIAGYEMFAMIRKSQVAAIPTNDMEAQSAFIASLFAVAA